MKTRRALVLFVPVIAIAAGLYGIKTYIDLKTYQAQIDALSISDVNLDTIEDGVYTGRHDVLWISAEVRVTVKNHRIEDIELIEHRNERGKPAEVIPDRVLFFPAFFQYVHRLMGVALLPLFNKASGISNTAAVPWNIRLRRCLSGIQILSQAHPVREKISPQNISI